jgi:hypothetical protein
MSKLIFHYNDGLYFCRDGQGKFYRGKEYSAAVRFDESQRQVTAETTAWFNFYLAGFDGEFYRAERG